MSAYRLDWDKEGDERGNHNRVVVCTQCDRTICTNNHNWDHTYREERVDDHYAEYHTADEQYRKWAVAFAYVDRGLAQSERVRDVHRLDRRGLGPLVQTLPNQVGLGQWEGQMQVGGQFARHIIPLDN